MNENSERTTQTKSLASNVIVLFTRIIAITIVNLYSVRLVLGGLGESDYGVFYAVAGVVMTLSCLLPVLSVCVQRFLSYAIGKGEKEVLQSIFSTSINITVALSLVILLLLLTVGMWFTVTQLNIPADRAWAIPYLNVFATLTLVFTLLHIPFTAAIYAHEDMNIYAFVSLVDCLLKLLVAIAIAHIDIDGLLVYSGGLMVVSLITLIIYAGFAIYKYPECRYRYTRDKSNYRKLLSFSGWTLYGSFAGVCMNQGNTIVLNISFGPVTNTSFGVGNNLYNAFNSLTGAIVLAFSPRMIKSYASGDLSYLDSLFQTGSKALFYLLIACSIPLIVVMDDILILWLGKTTEEITLFCRLFIVYAVCLAMHNPITTMIQAIGKLKHYHLIVESFTILCVPITWIVFKFGMPSHFVFVVMVSLCLVTHVVRLICLKRLYPRFSITNYLKNIVLPGAIIIVLVSFVANATNSISEGYWLKLSLTIVSSIATAIVLSYIIGCDKRERDMIHNIINRLIKRRTWE